MSKYLVRSNPQFHQQFVNIKRDIDRLGNMFISTGVVISEKEKQLWMDSAVSVENRFRELVKESLIRLEKYESEKHQDSY